MASKNPTPEGYLTGKLLIAMPGMADPRFYRSVIFICAHDEKGAMGLVINHTIPGIAFNELLEQIDLVSNIKVDLSILRFPVMSGGPVENARGFLLHSSDFKLSDTIPITDSLSVSGTVEALKQVAEGSGPDQMLFILGYAGWSAGQLDQELQSNAWLICECDPALIFHKQAEEIWSLAIQKLGIDPGRLSSAAGQA